MQRHTRNARFLTLLNDGGRRNEPTKRFEIALKTDMENVRYRHLAS